jgi:hypothetical protein
VAGTCFETSLKKWLELFYKGGKDIKIAHGLVTGKTGYVKDKKNGHAWVEINDQVCLDTETNITFPKEEYYEIGKINPEDVYLYDKKEIGHWVTTNGTYGPWELEETEFEKEMG